MGLKLTLGFVAMLITLGACFGLKALGITFVTPYWFLGVLGAMAWGWAISQRG